jgi:hypothetical protein
MYSVFLSIMVPTLIVVEVLSSTSSNARMTFVNNSSAQ